MGAQDGENAKQTRAGLPNMTFPLRGMGVNLAKVYAVQEDCEGGGGGEFKNFQEGVPATRNFANIIYGGSHPDGWTRTFTIKEDAPPPNDVCRNSHGRGGWTDG